MTAETIHIELTTREAATLQRVLQNCPEANSPEVEALRQKVSQSRAPETTEPLARVKAAVDAVDEGVTQRMEQRRQAIVAAIEAGYTQQAVADYLGRSQPRIAQMLKTNKHSSGMHSERREGV